MTNSVQIAMGYPWDNEDVPDLDTLDMLLGKVKARLFMKKGAGFLGSLMCDHEFVWDEEESTAWCNGETIGWNPKFFMWLTLEERITVLAHELWHTGYDHMARLSDPWICPDIANKAMDYVINGDLDHSGFVFGQKLMSIDPCLDHQYDNMSTEEVYALLPKPPVGQPMPQPDPGNGQPQQGQGQGGAQPDPSQPMQGDVQPSPSKDAADKIKGKLVKAAQASRMAGEAGVIPGETQLIIDKFLNPILPWEVLLMQYFTELSKDDYSWKRPSRRHEDEYLPSLEGDNGLEHLIYYMDISGSVSDKDILRFNSEVKHIHETFAPKRLTLVTFDTQLQDFYEFTDEMPFEEIVVHGRGGTSLSEVEAHIKKHQPTAAVVFSDLECAPMIDNPRVPILWIVVGNKSAKVPFGKKIHIDNER